MTDSINIRDQLSQYFINTQFDHRQCCSWMKQNDTIDAVKVFLGTTETVAKRFLGLMYIYRERDVIMGDTPLDNVLKRLTIGLQTKVKNGGSGEELYHATVRAKPIFQAWKARDKTTLLRYLEDETVRRSIRARDNRTQAASTTETPQTEDTQEELLEIIRVVGGADVVQRVEERCNRAWQIVNVNDLEQTVAQTMERAFWDATREKVSQGEMEPLYDVLTQAKDCVRALLSGAPLSRGQFDDRFDVNWIRERGEAGHLTREDVGNLAMYLAEQVGRMQAPADDHLVQPWVEAVRTRANENDALTAYLPDVVFVIRDAIHYLRVIYTRIKSYKK